MILTLSMVSILTITFTSSALSQISSGQSPGEIYISTGWYHDGINSHYGLFRSSDNGENLELMYQSLDNPPAGEMRVSEIHCDAQSGAIYNFGYYPYYDLWLSQDFGVNWEFIEHHSVNTNYYTGVVAGTIYKKDNLGLFLSRNFGYTFELLPISVNCYLTEVGYSENEFFGVYGEPGLYFVLVHTLDYGQTCTELTLDTSIAYGEIGGNYPEIFRGVEPGELYLVSWWPPSNYKIFHSVDTGFTWIQTYLSEEIDLSWWGDDYAAGRIPGSFYIARTRIDPTHTHYWLYIDYSNDYGQTFTTYFHDLTASVGIIKNLNMEPMIKAYPNPFNDLVTFELILSKDFVNPRLQIFDISNRQIIELNFGKSSKITWDGSDRNHNRLNSGIYCYRVIAENYESPV